MKRKILLSCYAICMLLMSVILMWRASSGYVFAYEYNSMNGKENADGETYMGHFAPGFLYCCATISISQSAHLILTAFVARTLFLQQGHIYFMLWLLGLAPAGLPVELPAPLPLVV